MVAKTRKRPFGLQAIIVLQLIQLIVWGMFFYTVFFSELGAVITEFVDVASVSYLIQIASNILLIVALPGLWLLKRWGWILLMIQLGISLSMGIWQFFEGNPNDVTMFLNVFIVFYLNQREVQALFEKKQPEQMEAWI